MRGRELSHQPNTRSSTPCHLLERCPASMVTCIISIMETMHATHFKQGFARNMFSKELLCHEMRFRDVFCRPFSFTLAEYKFYVSHPNTYQFTALIILILFSVDPHGYRHVMPVWETLAIWVAATAVFMLTCCAVLSGPVAL